MNVATVDSALQLVRAIQSGMPDRQIAADFQVARRRLQTLRLMLSAGHDVLLCLYTLKVTEWLFDLALGYRRHPTEPSVRAMCMAAGINNSTAIARMKKGLSLDKALLPARERIVGKKYGLLTVTGRVSKQNVAVRCECGAERVTSRGSLNQGRMRSCGCYRAKQLFGDIPETVEVFGRHMSVGQLSTISGRRAVAICARMRRGATPEEAAFGR